MNSTAKENCQTEARKYRKKNTTAKDPVIRTSRTRKRNGRADLISSPRALRKELERANSRAPRTATPLKTTAIQIPASNIAPRQPLVESPMRPGQLRNWWDVVRTQLKAQF